MQVARAAPLLVGDGHLGQAVFSIPEQARCLAIAILNDKRKIARETDKLTRRLMWQVAPESIVEIFTKISRMNRLSDFTRITKYLLGQMTMTMNRRNSGQDEDGG